MAHDRSHRRATRKSDKEIRKAEKDRVKQAQKDAGMGWVERQFAGRTKAALSMFGETGAEIGEAYYEGGVKGALDVLAGEPEDIGAPKQWDTLDEILSAMKRNRFARSSGYGQFFKGDRGSGQFFSSARNATVRNPTARRPGPGVGRPRRRGQMGRTAPGFGGAPQTRYGGF